MLMRGKLVDARGKIDMGGGSVAVEIAFIMGGWSQKGRKHLTWEALADAWDKT